LDRARGGRAQSPSRHLAAGLAAEWIGGLLDAGRLEEAREGCAPLGPRLNDTTRPSRQMALLRLTVARTLATSGSDAVARELEQAARDAGACDVPDLESVCWSTLGALQEKTDRLDEVLGSIRLGVAAQRRDEARAGRFRAALDSVMTTVPEVGAAESGVAAVPAGDGAQRGSSDAVATEVNGSPARRSRQHRPIDTGRNGTTGPLPARNGGGPPTGGPWTDWSSAVARDRNAGRPPVDDPLRPGGPADRATRPTRNGATESDHAARAGRASRDDDLRNGDLRNGDLRNGDTRNSDSHGSVADRDGVRQGDRRGPGSPGGGTLPGGRPGGATVSSGSTGGGSAGRDPAGTDSGARRSRDTGPSTGPLDGSSWPAGATGAQGADPADPWGSYPWQGWTDESPIGHLLARSLRPGGVDDTPEQPAGDTERRPDPSRPYGTGSGHEPGPVEEGRARDVRYGPDEGQRHNRDADRDAPDTGRRRRRRPEADADAVTDTSPGSESSSVDPWSTGSWSAEPWTGGSWTGSSWVSASAAAAPESPARGAGRSRRASAEASAGGSHRSEADGLEKATSTSSEERGGRRRRRLEDDETSTRAAVERVLRGDDRGDRDDGSRAIGSRRGRGTLAGQPGGERAGDRMSPAERPSAVGDAVERGERRDVARAARDRTDSDRAVADRAGSDRAVPERASGGTGTDRFRPTGVGSDRVGSDGGAGQDEVERAADLAVEPGSSSWLQNALAELDRAWNAMPSSAPSNTARPDATASADTAARPSSSSVEGIGDDVSAVVRTDGSGAGRARPAAPEAEGCVVVIDLARDGRRFAGRRAGTVMDALADQLVERLPSGARTRHDDTDALSVILPDWTRAPATEWMHRTLPALFEDFVTTEDLPGTQLRAAVHDADGPVGAQLLQRLDVGSRRRQPAAASPATGTSWGGSPPASGRRSRHMVATGSFPAVRPAALSPWADVEPGAGTARPDAGRPGSARSDSALNDAGRSDSGRASTDPHGYGRRDPDARDPDARDGDTGDGDRAGRGGRGTGAGAEDGPAIHDRGGRRSRDDHAVRASSAEATGAATGGRRHRRGPEGGPASEPGPGRDRTDPAASTDGLGLADLLAGALAAYRGI
ncbi:MAG: collagen type alpha, partial [Pseudonocardiales bacterium]|nr:collagen type alpha [Pseudonocardiales bacterium]